MGQYEGKVAVITGGGGGIAYGIAIACLKEGMKVVLADISAERLAGQLEKLKSEAGGQVATFKMDVTKEEDFKKLAAFTRETYGRVDMLFNNAGVHFHKSFRILTDNDWKFILGCNLWSVIYGMRTFIPILNDNPEGGHIINIASSGALSFGATMSQYCATKAAMLMLSGSVQQELIAEGSKVLITVVLPDFVPSNLMNSAADVRPPELRNEVEEQTPLDKQVEAFFRMNVDAPYRGGPLPELAISSVAAGEAIMQGIKDQKIFVFTHPDRENFYSSMLSQQLISGILFAGVAGA
ncbi:MAG: SDR family oxidoreductase [Dethiobacteria bacterium]|jgi:NAD(P)-dependent dehydrogenase (short-subunit alcohol dehydrogenase family)|nr:SDR family oxidoreductase [Bacillota bacterium]HPZ65242.1 SDR family oxidoreductase [Bacillota bacterium]HQD06607.1 SDR family oxidoreductase [Bacillota bacterium]